MPLNQPCHLSAAGAGEQLARGTGEKLWNKLQGSMIPGRTRLMMKWVVKLLKGLITNLLWFWVGNKDRLGQCLLPKQIVSLPSDT